MMNNKIIQVPLKQHQIRKIESGRLRAPKEKAIDKFVLAMLPALVYVIIFLLHRYFSHID